MTDLSNNAAKTLTHSPRLNSIDFMRGLVMVIMALDHIRDYVFLGQIDPLNMEQSHSFLYFTRWITHLCAPVFVILAGLSVGLIAQKHNNISLSKFLLSRGIWLIFAEVTFIAFAWNFLIFENFLPALMVIWALGFSMICLAGLIWLPRSIIWIIALGIIFGHNGFDGTLPVNNFNQPMPFWWGIHVTGFSSFLGTNLVVAYPVIPWIGVMALGYLIAPIYQKPAEARQALLVKVGLACIILFFILRVPNIYGNPTPWIEQSSTWLNFLAMMNVEKYPPSLQYLLITLGIGAIILAKAEHWQSKFHDWMVTFGRVPFFYYVLHLFLIHFIALLISEIQGFGWQTVLNGFWTFPKEYGISLVGTYLIWLGITLTLYPCCKWFMQLKARRNDWWLKYL